MRSTGVQVVPSTQIDSSTTTIGKRLRMVVAQRTEEILAEVAPTLRRLRTFLLVLTISIPLFMAGLLLVLLRLAH